jgi:prepilin-type N-terminal cleavage/methylation domain-containing protein
MTVEMRRKVASTKGFSLIEMMMTLAIGLILMSLALPAMVSAIQGYRLNSIAQQTSHLIDLARYTAIRRNGIVSLHKAPPQNGNTVLFIDLDGDGVLGANEPMIVIPNDMQIANGDALTPAAASTAIPNVQDFVDVISFDYRGTVNFSGGGGTGAYFLALGYINQAQYGCRAVTVIPMGQTKIWKAPAGGTWTAM